ncbi:MAG: glycoside hydrolase family 15 protein [Dokdonella sp.]
MRLEDLSLVGNCQMSALISRAGSVVWCCLPRFDSEPVFGRLLDESGGEFSVAPADGQHGEQRYVGNTNILETVFDTPTGRFRVVDFAPRYASPERMQRPAQLVRIIEPLEGAALVRVQCRPVQGWSKQSSQGRTCEDGLFFDGFPDSLRLVTDVSGAHLYGAPFALTKRLHLVLSWGDAVVEQPLADTCSRLLDATARYWQRWVKHCNIPPMFQREVIRSALVLKLHCFEETGAIVAAMTTSIPESAGSGRTWDYRYCWLRDAYYVLDALRLLGHFEEREGFIQFLLGITAASPDMDLRPLYRVDGSSDLDERILTNWAGFNADGPVRVGNGAALHQQHDVYGELILGLSPIFLDARFEQERAPQTLDLLERLARRAIAVAGTPDAGIWEVRRAWEPQTFSSLMCWAAADRVAHITQTQRPAVAQEYRDAADRIRDDILHHAWSERFGRFAASYGADDLDAALLQMVPLRFLPRDDPRLLATIEAVRNELSENGWLLRYRRDDGLGVPTVAFVICTFWLADALALVGRIEEAQAIMARISEVLSPTGLIAEDCDIASRRLWGNYPQAYSHVGLIHAAFAASPRWAEFL